MPRNRIIGFLLAVFLLVAAIVIFSRPVILLFARKQLSSVFKDSKIYIGGCNLRPLSGLSLFDIEIKKDKIYELKIREAGIDYKIPAIFKNGLSGFYLKDLSYNGPGLYLENASLKANRSEQPEGLIIRQVDYNKLKLTEIKSKTRLEGQTLFLDSLSAKILDGELQADLRLKMDNNQAYLAVLKFLNLDLDKFVKDFELEEKVQMSGRLSGKVVLEGRGSDINVLSGDFSTAGQGGMLVIKDTKFLENMASNSQQSLDILVESFKDYHYNKGIMTLSLDKGNLILDAALDGEAGKRNLDIILHNFKL